MVIYLVFVGLNGNVILEALLGRATDPAAITALSLAIAYAVLITTIWVLASRLERLRAPGRAVVRPEVKVLRQSLQMKRCSGLVGPSSPCGVERVLPLRLVLRR